jgi:phosphoenolpyruvate-protein phosphotransferase (PTS system enzyme I)
MAGDTTFTRLLLAMGLRSFSMHPRQIAEVKQTVLRADAGRLAQYLPQLLGADDPQSVARSVLGG